MKSLIEKYKTYLPFQDMTQIVSLGEGNTPLLPLNSLAKQLGKNLKLFAKFEGMNPTGSFKDRGMTAAITQAAIEKAKTVICASTGNTSASASAYAARANLNCYVIIPEGKIAFGKLAQAIAHGAKVIQIEGNFDEGLNYVRRLADKQDLAIVNSINPFRLQGQKTVAFEVVDDLGCAPDYHILPVGNAGNISAHWMGYCDYFKQKRIDKLPRLVGFQAEGAAPFIAGHPIEKPETIATAIRIGNPASKDKAEKAVSETNGWFDKVSDKQILKAQKLLADEEGIFCEPASSSSFAGLLQAIEQKRIADNSTIVCTLTGHGLKDPQIVTDLYADQALIKMDSFEQIAELI